MLRVTGEVVIAAPAERVWEVLADLGGIERWSPTVGRSRVTTEQARGAGARRQLELVGGRHLDRSIEDNVLEWEEGRRYLIDSTGMRMMKVVRNEWSLRADGEGTLVELSSELAARLGPLGALLERTMLPREMRRSVALILNGFKHCIETGESADAELPAGAQLAATVR